MPVILPLLGELFFIVNRFFKNSLISILINSPTPRQSPRKCKHLLRVFQDKLITHVNKAVYIRLPWLHAFSEKEPLHNYFFTCGHSTNMRFADMLFIVVITFAGL